MIAIATAPTRPDNASHTVAVLPSRDLDRLLRPHLDAVEAYEYRTLTDTITLNGCANQLSAWSGTCVGSYGPLVHTRQDAIITGAHPGGFAIQLSLASAAALTALHTTEHALTQPVVLGVSDRSELDVWTHSAVTGLGRPLATLHGCTDDAARKIPYLRLLINEEDDLAGLARRRRDDRRMTRQHRLMRTALAESASLPPLLGSSPEKVTLPPRVHRAIVNDFAGRIIVRPGTLVAAIDSTAG